MSVFWDKYDEDRWKHKYSEDLIVYCFPTPYGSCRYALEIELFGSQPMPFAVNDDPSPMMDWYEKTAHKILVDLFAPAARDRGC